MYLQRVNQQVQIKERRSHAYGQRLISVSKANTFFPSIP